VVVEAESPLCFSYKYPQTKLGFGHRLSLSNGVLLMQSVLQNSYAQVYDLVTRKRTLLIPPDKSPRNGNSIVRKDDGKSGVIAMVIPGQQVSAYFRPNPLDFKAAAKLMAIDGYICPPKRGKKKIKSPLRCSAILKDTSIRRAFYEWQVSWGGDISNIQGNVKLKKARGSSSEVYEVQLEFLKKSKKLYSEKLVEGGSGRKQEIGRLEKMMVCAKRVKPTSSANNSTAINQTTTVMMGEGYVTVGSQTAGTSAHGALEQCCVTKRACGVGIGTISNDFCNPPPPEEFNRPLKGW